MGRPRTRSLVKSSREYDPGKLLLTNQDVKQPETSLESYPKGPNERVVFSRSQIELDTITEHSGQRARMLRNNIMMNSVAVPDHEKLTPKRHLPLLEVEGVHPKLSKRQRIRSVKWVETPYVYKDERKSDEYDHAKIWYSVSFVIVFSTLHHSLIRFSVDLTLEV